MVQRILFTPFDTFTAPRPSDAPGDEYYHKNNLWSLQVRERQQRQPAKAIVREGNTANSLATVYYRPRMARSKRMRDLGPEDQIYIRGHSLVGFGGIFAHAEHDEAGKPIHQSKMNDDLFRLLYKPGVQGPRATKFSLGAAAVVDRLAAAGLETSFAGWIKCYNCHSAEGEPNFATELARALADKGFARCGVIGYTGALSSAYDGNHKTSTDASGVSSRASQNRVVIRQRS